MSAADTCIAGCVVSGMRWHELNPGSDTERENLTIDVKETAQADTRGPIPMQWLRGGPGRSSDEVPVIGMEQRTGAIQIVSS